MKKWAIALLALLIASPLYAEEKYNTNGVAGALPIPVAPGQIVISTQTGFDWVTLGGGNGNCFIQVNGPGSASLICPNFGSGTGATLPPGGPPQFIGYSTTDQVEAETMVGDVTMLRTGPNTYTATVVAISSVLPALQVAGPVAINGPLSVTGQTTVNNITGAAANFTTVTATSSITAANAIITGVLNFGTNGNLYFNGNPMGGTCPNGQFVNTINARGVPTCSVLPESAAATFVGDTPPPNPVEGQLWFNTADLQTYIWYNDGTSSQWVAIVNIVAGGGAPSNNPAFTGTATFQNITVSGNSIFNGPSTFNNTVTFPDGSTWTSNMLYFNENTTVNMPNLTNFPGGWTPWNWASPADNVPAFWDDTGIEQLYDVTTQYVTLPVPTPGSPSSANAPDNLEVLVMTNPDDATHNYPWGQYTLQNYGAPPLPDAGNTQTWQAEGLEFINSIGIHGDTWSGGCTVVDVNAAYLSDCAIAARASSLYNNINYKILVTNQSSGTLARASYALNTTNSWAAMSLSGSGFTPANGQQPDQLDINTNASNGINFTIGSGSTIPISVAQITTSGMNVNGTVTINGQPIAGGGPWLPVNNPTYTGTLSGPNEVNTGALNSLTWVFPGEGLSASFGDGYGNTSETSFLIGQSMYYNASVPHSWTLGGTTQYGPTSATSLQFFGAATAITGDTGLSTGQAFTPTMLFSISPVEYDGAFNIMGNQIVPVGAAFWLPVKVTLPGTPTAGNVITTTATINGDVLVSIMNGDPGTGNAARAGLRLNAGTLNHNFWIFNQGDSFTGQPDTGVVYTDGELLLASGYIANSEIQMDVNGTGQVLVTGQAAAGGKAGLTILGGSAGGWSQLFMDGGGLMSGYNSNINLIAGAHFSPPPTQQWIADWPSASYVSMGGNVISFLADTGLTEGAPFNPTIRAQITEFGINVDHMSNMYGAGIPTVSEGQLAAGSRDTFGWITGFGNVTHLTFSHPFINQSDCTFSDAGQPLSFYAANQTAAGLDIVCFVPWTGQGCVAPQAWVEYICAGLQN